MTTYICLKAHICEEPPPKSELWAVYVEKAAAR